MILGAVFWVGPRQLRRSPRHTPPNSFRSLSPYWHTITSLLVSTHNFQFRLLPQPVEEKQNSSMLITETFHDVPTKADGNGSIRIVNETSLSSFIIYVGEREIDFCSPKGYSSSIQPFQITFRHASLESLSSVRYIKACRATPCPDSVNINQLNARVF